MDNTNFSNNYKTTKTDDQMIELIDRAIITVESNMFMPMPDYYQRNVTLVASLKDMKQDVLYGRVARGYSIIREMHMLQDADSNELIELISEINEFYKKNYKCEFHDDR